MIIYAAHASSYNYKDLLYTPLRSTQEPDVTFILPHEGIVSNSKDALATCDFVLAEVSYPSTGMGIELGWANNFKKKIICVYRAGTEPSKSLRFISDTFFEYSSEDDLRKCVRSIISSKKL